MSYKSSFLKQQQRQCAAAAVCVSVCSRKRHQTTASKNTKTLTCVDVAIRIEKKIIAKEKKNCMWVLSPAHPQWILHRLGSAVRAK